MNKKKKELKTMLHYGGHTKEIIIIFIVIAIEVIYYYVYYPILSKPIIDIEIANRNLKGVFILSSLLIGCTLIRFCYNSYTERKRKKACSKIDVDLKRDIFKAIQRIKTQKLETKQIGELIELSTTQAIKASKVFVWNAVGIISVRGTSFIILAIVTCWLDIKIGLVTTGIFIISYFMVSPIYKKTFQIHKKIQQEILKIQSVVNEIIDSYTTVKTLRIEEINNQHIKELLEEYNKEIISSKNMLTIHNIVFSIFSFIATLAVILIGGGELAFGLTTASVIMLAVEYMENMREQINVLLEHIHLANQRYNSFSKILEMMEEEKETQGTQKLDKIKKIEYQNVTLSYDGKNIILDHINLLVDKPTKIALVGKSGSGKTSFVNLLPRFYEITEGKILINDVDVTQYELPELRKHISYVFQEPVVFHMSILENIIYGCPRKVSKQEVEDICKKIGLHEKIEKLEEGYQTIINNTTDKLSYGEKQLLNFARAILKNADIMILDEVTSNLDLEFEEKVMKATQEILNNKFVFIIAHRLKTIKSADKILFLQEGKILEQGTHKELIQKQGQYYQQLINFDTISV